MNVIICVCFLHEMTVPEPDHVAHVLRLSRLIVYEYLREFPSEGNTRHDTGGSAGK